jgi:glucose-6-phosphate isomerase
MHISYFDDARVTESLMKRKERELTAYSTKIAEAEAAFDLTIPEASLYYAKDIELNEVIAEATKKSKSLKYVVLVGIGGSSLGTEAVHSVLNAGKTQLLVLDTVSVSRLHDVKTALLSCKKASQVAVCVISKSGGTAETLANASIILDELETRLRATLRDQVYFIGNAGTDFMKYGKKYGATCVAMPEIIGGRYSVATAVGLIPLALLGHDVDEFVSGYLDVMSPTLESVVAESAARLSVYHSLKFPHYNFFAFESRLEKLGQWYRQLFAESLGKETDINGKKVTHAMVPAIATPVELHSVGQLYMSGVPDVYTDFVSFDDEELDVMIPKGTKLAKELKGYSLQEVATALYGGVIAAYQERQLPYRATVFEENLAYSIGQFMAMRLREVMYTAHLLKVNAFDQPNVELYKNKTREILFL